MNDPRLFGLDHTNSNRDFRKEASWGKNQFNSAFPVALACYMYQQALQPVFLKLSPQLTVAHSTISVQSLFGAAPLSQDLYFNFESSFSPFQVFVEGSLPGVDLVTMDNSGWGARPLRALEVKLTALPDNTTHKRDESQYGTELVIRPQTIAYLAIHLILAAQKDSVAIGNILQPVCRNVSDWADPSEMKSKLGRLIDGLDAVLLHSIDTQAPMLLQPVWKTQGKSPRLATQCLDIFAWSAHALTRLFVDAAKGKVGSHGKVTRQERTVIWVVRMLYDYVQHGSFDYDGIIDALTLNVKNDKAFSITGTRTHQYMNSPELTQPRISKDSIKEIILGGGQNLLSPERRLDAIISNSPGLFD